MLEDLKVYFMTFAIYYWVKIRDGISNMLGVGVDLTKTTKEHMHIQYNLGENNHKIMLPINYGPSPFFKFFHRDKDVSHDIKPYVGPHGNFHGVSYTPSMFGYDKLTVVYRKNSVTITYEKDDVITLSPPTMKPKEDDEH